MRPLDEGGDRHEEEHGPAVESGPGVAAQGRGLAPDLVAEVPGDPGDGDEADHALIDGVDTRKVEASGGVPGEPTVRGSGRKRRGR